MTGGVSGPSGSDPSKPKPPLPHGETGMAKTYTAKKAPGFKKWLEIWFPGKVTDKMVSQYEQNMMKMIQISLKKAEAQHKKVEQMIKKRIDRG